MKIAGAPISWGVCEVPGWGPMLASDRVLRELTGLGMNAIELGAPGFLPDTPEAVKAQLDQHGVSLIGGFVPVVLHLEAEREATLASAREWAHTLSAGGGNHFISAIVVDAAWSPRYELSLAEWKHMFEMFDEIDDICTEFGLEQVLHPHVNTLIETASDVQRVLDNSGVGWCLDTGHLAIGGFDPVDLARKYADRVRHVHLKDVDMAVAERLNAGEMTLMQGVFDGLFQNLGNGDVDIAGVLATVQKSGFDGWYVLEQDCSIEGDAPAEGTGPVEDIAISLEFVRRHLSAA
jgi:inosose dehydratase